MPVLSRLDTLTVLVSVGMATALHFWRARNGRADGKEQWLGDALSCGTVFVLALIGLEAMTGDRWGLGDLVKSNSYLVVMSLFNCARATVSGLYNSVRRIGSGADMQGE